MYTVVLLWCHWLHHASHLCCSQQWLHHYNGIANQDDSAWQLTIHGVTNVYCFIFMVNCWLSWLVMGHTTAWVCRAGNSLTVVLCCVQWPTTTASNAWWSIPITAHAVYCNGLQCILHHLPMFSWVWGHVWYCDEYQTALIFYSYFPMLTASCPWIHCSPHEDM